MRKAVAKLVVWHLGIIILSQKIIIVALRISTDSGSDEYILLEYTLDNHWSSRFRLEMSNEGDFESNSDMVPIVKDAWLKYKFANQSIYLGMSATPTFALIEDTWGYRSVEKVSVDLYKMGSSKNLELQVKDLLMRKVYLTII